MDNALWDLKARLLGLPLVSLLGTGREGIPIYGSGGFTSYSIDQLQSQLAGWVDAGISMVKMKIGRDPERDVDRVRVAREAIGEKTKLFVDANGAYGRTQALSFASRFEPYGVSWFEEPVSSDDLEGLGFVRDRAPEGMDIAAGSTDTMPGTFAACWKLALWMYCRQMPRGVRELPVSFRLAHFAGHARYHYRHTLPHRFTRTCAVRSLRYDIWNISMITSGSKTCSSMGLFNQKEECFIRI